MSQTIDILEGQFIVPARAQSRLLLNESDPIPWGSHPEAGLRLYSRTPILLNEELRDIVSVNDLDTRPGWVPVKANLTPQVRYADMGRLFFTSSVDNKNKQTISLVTKDGAPALLEDSIGWAVSSGVPGIEQEPVAVAALYLKGVYSGIKDPVLCLTEQGLGAGLLLRSGAMYGMTKYTETIPPSVFTNQMTLGARIRIDTVTLRGHYGTVTCGDGTTPRAHRLQVGDLAQTTVWVGGFTAVNTFRVVDVVDEYTFVAEATTNGSLDLNLADTPGAIGEVRKITYDIHPGTLLLDTPPPPYEPANSEHVWLRPQRINLLANPHLAPDDDGSTFGWRGGRLGGGTATTVGAPAESTGQGHAVGLLIGETGLGRMVLESNAFPVVDNNFISIALDVVGVGTMRVGVVAWDNYFSQSTYIRLPDVTVNNMKIGGDGPEPNGPIHEFRGVLPTLPGTAEYHLRIEWMQNQNVAGTILPDGQGALILVNALVDPTDNAAVYFDGDSHDSLAGDYHWHGGESNRHFSMFYNNRKNTEGRLFGATNLLSEWVPSEATVIPHWDAMEGAPVDGWYGDYYYTIKDVKGTPALESPGQEFDRKLTPIYPLALLDEGDSLVRNEMGDPIIVDMGIIPDDTLLDEQGNPLYVEAGNPLEDGPLLVP